MPEIVGNVEGRSGGARIRSSGGRPVMEETYHFRIKSDFVGQTRAEILYNTPGLPQIGWAGPWGMTVCNGVDVERDEKAVLYWDATAEFSSEITEGSGAPATTDPNVPFEPEAWVPVYETKFERIQEVVTQDASGNAIVNSAGQAFETGLTRTRFIPVWEFYQFEPATVTDEQVIDRNEVVNGATFATSRAAKTLLCVVLSSVIGTYYGQPRRLTQYQLKYNKRTWQHKRLDVGTQYKSGTTLLDFTSSDGSIMLGALNGSGGKQAAGTAPAIRTFDEYATNDFSFIRT